MVVGPSGLSLKRSAPYTPKIVQYSTAGYIVLRGATMDDICDLLAARVFDRPVVNRTDLKGAYDFTQNWSAKDLTGPSLFTAIEEQLGLRLAIEKLPARILIVDNVNRAPTAN